MIINTHTKESAGFALLMTIIVVGVVLSIGLTILDLSIKQVRLASAAKDSEIAFHATNAGLECARYWQRQAASLIEVGDQFSPTCFEEAPEEVTPLGPSGNSPNLDNFADGEAYLYEYSFTWGADSDRCSEISSLIVSADLTGNGVEVDNMNVLFPDNKEFKAPNNTFDCEQGSRCSVISVRGYNKPCTSISGYGTIRREVLLQF